MSVIVYISSLRFYLQISILIGFQLVFIFIWWMTWSSDPGVYFQALKVPHDQMCSKNIWTLSVAEVIPSTSTSYWPASSGGKRCVD